MIFQLVDIQKQREQFKSRLGSSCLRFVGSFSPMISRLIEKKGFDGLYISGALGSSFLGFPDIGLIGLSELARFAGKVISHSSLPSLADADTGFGGALTSARTVYELEKRGLSGLHIEDQTFPKRCGHLDKKKLIPTEEMVLKIKSAVKARKDKNFLIIARTDARGVEGIGSAIDRAKEYVLAGADMIFPEALQSVGEFERFRSELSLPLIANMTEFGKTDIIPYSVFKKMAYNIVIYPVSLWRLSLKAVDEGLSTLAEDRQAHLLPKMQTRKELYSLLEYEAYSQFEGDVFNFSK